MSTGSSRTAANGRSPGVRCSRTATSRGPKRRRSSDVSREEAGSIVRAVRNAPPTVEVVEIDEPEGEGVLVRVAATGICASDLNYLRFGSTQIAGHEFAGVTEDGTPVAVEAIFGCGVCS